MFFSSKIEFSNLSLFGWHEWTVIATLQATCASSWAMQ
jgi:hypothetical protein